MTYQKTIKRKVGTLTTDPKEIANKINKFFTKSSNEITDKTQLR